MWVRAAKVMMHQAMTLPIVPELVAVPEAPRPVTRPFLDSRHLGSSTFALQERRAGRGVLGPSRRS